MKLYCKECQKMKCLIGELVCDDCASKIRCEYCGKKNSKDDSKMVNVYENRGRKERWFCKDDTCASYYQMGAEG